ncbi:MULTISPECIES: hypothetical protein [Burkholderia]|uniref:hypothetical protein n=1 Tax=Burkholderia TaxID=32008 RepID=UPI0015893F54|nr:hypothetical protein [Burkholderia cepacia]MCA7891408.1 hypothetical protein [Burkholderia cepacia]MCA8053337.1 hypothetical protein [Burkholderia cepacia]MCA8132361.1 hypothetical protein [Burkholderia cepacia]MCA8162442.1 hypothetical protein [Burkholderia cepacia]HEM7889126.1 hypothetical protein [Burkholderia cepacia]
MQLDSTRFHIDPTPRRADGEYMAHARISIDRADGSKCDVQLSGDLAGFDVREDAIAFAKNWAHEWLDAHLANDLPVLTN